MTLTRHYVNVKQIHFHAFFQNHLDHRKTHWFTLVLMSWLYFSGPCSKGFTKNVFFISDDLCPVKSFVTYTRHLRGNKCDRLFQRPSLKENSVGWYESAPMGNNTIGNMMPNLSEKAGLSRRYTNHSLRATSVNVLDNIGNFASRHIMTVMGHKSENSLKT